MTSATASKADHALEELIKDAKKSAADNPSQSPQIAVVTGIAAIVVELRAIRDLLEEKL